MTRSWKYANHGGGRPPLTDWDAVTAALKTRPGQWALVLQGVPSANVYRINKGIHKAFCDGLYEARSEGHGKYDVYTYIDLYIRYIGPKEKEEE